jgi:hypothetical protein
MSRQQSGFFQLDGHRIAFATVGTGPPLVLPAWWVSNIVEDWKDERFRYVIDALATGRQVIRYDRLGCGMSDRNRPLEAIAPPTKARQRLRRSACGTAAIPKTSSTNHSKSSPGANTSPARATPRKAAALQRIARRSEAGSAAAVVPPPTSVPFAMETSTSSPTAAPGGGN